MFTNINKPIVQKQLNDIPFKFPKNVHGLPEGKDIECKICYEAMVEARECINNRNVDPEINCGVQFCKACMVEMK